MELILAFAALVAAQPVSHERLPVPTRSSVPYASKSASQVANLYLPHGKGPFPTVIMIHGGAFMFGRPDDVGPGFKDDVEALNKDGIAVVSIGYRLSKEAKFPAAVQDVKAAIRYVRSHAGENRLDPARIALWGKSAGANLALLGGLARTSEFDDPQLADPRISDRVKGIVAFYPPVDFLLLDTQLAKRGCKFGSDPFTGAHDPATSPESKYLGAALQTVPQLTARSNPANYVTPDAPPVLLEVGTADCTVGPDQSILMFNALKAKAPSSKPQLFFVQGAKHADPLLEQGPSLARVRRFFRQLLLR